MSSPRTQGSFTVPPQPPINRPGFTPASPPGSITGSTQNVTFHDVRANYSHSSAPFFPSRFQTINSEVTNLKNTVNQMQQSITAVENRMQQLPDVLEQLFSRYTSQGPVASVQTSAPSVESSKHSTNDGLSYATQSSIEDEIANLPPGYSQELLKQQNQQMPLRRPPSLTSGPGTTVPPPVVQIPCPPPVPLPPAMLSSSTVPRQPNHHVPRMPNTPIPPPAMTTQVASPAPTPLVTATAPNATLSTDNTHVQTSKLAPNTEMQSFLTSLTETISQQSNSSQLLKLPKFKATNDGTMFYPWKHEVFNNCIIHPVM